MTLEESGKSSSASIVVLVIALIVIGGIGCVYKQKCQEKSLESNSRRSSVESRTSETLDENIEDEDE